MWIILCAIVTNNQPFRITIMEETVFTGLFFNIYDLIPLFQIITKSGELSSYRGKQLQISNCVLSKQVY